MCWVYQGDIMKFFENWLCSYVLIFVLCDELSVVLIVIGLEVEEVIVFGEGFDYVVVVCIVEVVCYLEVDCLQVCRVDVGQGELLQIVCGVLNVCLGLVVLLVMVGVQIGELKIKLVKLCGVEFNGMLCLVKELGLDNDVFGLLELFDDVLVGQVLVEYFGLLDVSIEIKLILNCVDCFSLCGIVYDVVVVICSEVLDFVVDVILVVGSCELVIQFDVGVEVLCYLGCVIEGVNVVVRILLWMVECLCCSGVCLVLLLVDIIQYVMLELGQLMYVYDFGILQGSIVVCCLCVGESLKLLDGCDVVLDDSFLVVIDVDCVIGLVGLMGGFDICVIDVIIVVFLEVVYFVFVVIMGCGCKLGLYIDVGYCFECGVDLVLLCIVIEYVICLVLDLVGGILVLVIEVVCDVDLLQLIIIVLCCVCIVCVFGIIIDDVEIECILCVLGMDVVVIVDGWQVVVLSCCFDIVIEEDLIEELVCIYGYEQILIMLLGGVLCVVMLSEIQLDVLSVCCQLIVCDQQEIVNFVFVDDVLLIQWQLCDGLVLLVNLLLVELVVMCLLLLLGLVVILGCNVVCQFGCVCLFELGCVFVQQVGGVLIGESWLVLLEILCVVVVVCGEVQVVQWGLLICKVDFYDLKGDLELLVVVSGVVLEFCLLVCVYGYLVWLVEVFCDGVVIGWIGQIYLCLVKVMDIEVDVYVFELDLELLSVWCLLCVGELLCFLVVCCDLVFLVFEQVVWIDLVVIVCQVVGLLLCDLNLFDCYVGQGVELGFKSFVMGLILQDKLCILMDCDVDVVVVEVVIVIECEYYVWIRG